MRHPTKHRKSTGPENSGPERPDFGGVGMGEVGSPPAITLENNGKFRLYERPENELYRGVGGGDGPDVEPSPFFPTGLKGKYSFLSDI